MAPTDAWRFTVTFKEFHTFCTLILSKKVVTKRDYQDVVLELSVLALNVSRSDYSKAYRLMLLIESKHLRTSTACLGCTHQKRLFAFASHREIEFKVSLNTDLVNQPQSSAGSICVTGNVGMGRRVAHPARRFGLLMSDMFTDQANTSSPFHAVGAGCSSSLSIEV